VDSSYYAAKTNNAETVSPAEDEFGRRNSQNAYSSPCEGAVVQACRALFASGWMA
jgi:hypothetical protein